MSQFPDKTTTSSPTVGNPIVPCLYAMAFIIGAVSLIAILFRLGAVLSRSEGAVAIDEVIGIVMVGVGGVAAALLLAGIAAVVNYLQHQMQMLARMTRAQEDTVAALMRLGQSAGGIVLPPEPPSGAEAGGGSAGWLDVQRYEQLQELLHELNENVLLSSEQRQAKRLQQVEGIRRDLEGSLSHLLSQGRFPDAQARLDAYARTCPDERGAIETFQARIDEARTAAEESEYQDAASRIRELVGTASWERAEQVARDLVARHPKSQRVRELVDGLCQERSRFEQQQRQQMVAQVEQRVAARDHREAFRLASEVIARFPDTVEARLLQGKMDTLRDNAEIAIRRDLEEQYKEFMRTHRYIEALALAQDVIGKYPASPQAKVLKEQLPQLMSKAKLQMEQAGGA